MRITLPRIFGVVALALVIVLWNNMIYHRTHPEYGKNLYATVTPLPAETQVFENLILRSDKMKNKAYSSNLQAWLKSMQNLDTMLVQYSNGRMVDTDSVTVNFFYAYEAYKKMAVPADVMEVHKKVGEIFESMQRSMHLVVAGQVEEWLQERRNCWKLAKELSALVDNE